jgi:hypothetical protein
LPFKWLIVKSFLIKSGTEQYNTLCHEISRLFKGTQAWNNFEFFLAKIKSLYALRKFLKKIFLWFSPEFRNSNIFAVTEHTRNQIFCRDIQKIFFQNVHFGSIRWVPKRFFKIYIFYSRNLHFNLGFLSNFRKL